MSESEQGSGGGTESPLICCLIEIRRRSRLKIQCAQNNANLCGPFKKEKKETCMCLCVCLWLCARVCVWDGLTGPAAYRDPRLPLLLPLVLPSLAFQPPLLPHPAPLSTTISLLPVSGPWSVMSTSFILTNVLSARIVHRMVYSPAVDMNHSTATHTYTHTHTLTHTYLTTHRYTLSSYNHAHTKHMCQWAHTLWTHMLSHT